MASNAKVSPFVKRDPKQRSEIPFISRIVPMWATPTALSAEQWRTAVRHQPVAMICRDTIVSNLQSTPWRIVPRDPTPSTLGSNGKIISDPYKEDVDYYTTLFNGIDGSWDIHIDLLMQDALDIPFGGADEIIREGDDPNGRVTNVLHIDGGTLAPTYNPEVPVVQTYYSAVPVYFPWWSVSRVYYTPRPEITRLGWGMAAPERIYLALELLYRGDRYYANLLLDTPESGVLDLGDMDSETAEDWLKSWRNLLQGTDAFKVPVLYEHTVPATWIPFTRTPVDLAYDKSTLRYMQIVAAGYGLSLTDIGIVEGDTGSLAGTIRSERRSIRSGFGAARIKVKAHHDRILPPHLMFEFVERDDEILAAVGRARLANSMAMRNLVDGKIIVAEDAQEQLQKDGLLTVPLQVVGSFDSTQNDELITPRHVVANELQKPVPASQGGEGEINARSLVSFSGTVTPSLIEREKSIAGGVLSELLGARDNLTDEQFAWWRSQVFDVIDGEPCELGEYLTPLIVRAIDSCVTDLTIVVDNVFETCDLVTYATKVLSKANKAISQYVFESGAKPLYTPVVSITNEDMCKEITALGNQAMSEAGFEVRRAIARSVIKQLFEPTFDAHTASMLAINSIVDGVSSSLHSELCTMVMSRALPDGGVPEKLWEGN
jgi:hypothetical protein